MTSGVCRVQSLFFSRTPLAFVPFVIANTLDLSFTIPSCMSISCLDLHLSFRNLVITL